MKFAEEQIADIMYNGGVYDESGENCLYELVDETHAYYVIKEISTGKFFKSELTQSSWRLQAENNAKKEWKEVSHRS